ncbi:MAG: His/Gly/Thr/Pro-type tRNA ligase C-terminal domain-containing protein, partial [Alphaproteobacteria bacterium]
FIGENAVRVGSRPFWDALFDYLEMNDGQKKDVFVLIDKKDKMGDDDFAEGLKDTLGNAEKENQIKSVFINGYSGFLNKSDKLDAAVAELNDFMKTLELFGVKNAEIDLSITRGLAYYTGLVFEFKLLSHPELGTAAGGGRYADLAGKFSKTKIIGVGAAIGFSRIFVALMEFGAIDLSRFESPVDVSVLCMGADNLAYAVSALNALRDANVASVAYLDADKKFKNQIEYSDKINARFSMIIGEDEAKNQVVALKNMTTGEQQSLSILDAVKMVQGE